ncbi:hypothetical protein ACGF1Z_12500 [Streptomyces sp. NPDC048018]|uniref:hypothetical protein n=1 Tax=Streptomyces sp. NPDC048018 TaxID=3365499 RepID=UPI00371180EE
MEKHEHRWGPLVAICVLPILLLAGYEHARRYREEWNAEFDELGPWGAILRYTSAITFTAWAVGATLAAQKHGTNRSLPRTLSLVAMLTGNPERYEREYAADWYDVRTRPFLFRCRYVINTSLRAGVIGVRSLSAKLGRT